MQDYQLYQKVTVLTYRQTLFFKYISTLLLLITETIDTYFKSIWLCLCQICHQHRSIGMMKASVHSNICLAEATSTFVHQDIISNFGHISNRYEIWVSPNSSQFIRVKILQYLTQKQSGQWLIII